MIDKSTFDSFAQKFWNEFLKQQEDKVDWLSVREFLDQPVDWLSKSFGING